METQDNTSVPYSALESDIEFVAVNKTNKKCGNNKVRTKWIAIIAVSLLLFAAALIVIFDFTNVMDNNNNNNNNSKSKNKNYNSKTSLMRQASDKKHTKNMMASKYLFSNNGDHDSDVSDYYPYSANENGRSVYDFYDGNFNDEETEDGEEDFDTETEEGEDTNAGGTGEEPEEGEEFRRRRLLADSNATDISIVNFDDIQYYGTIEMGGQTFTVLFDSGSSDLWLPGVDCTDCNCSHYYDCEASDSCVSSAATWSITYGSGSAEGYLVSDELKVEGLKGTVNFGVATSDPTSSSSLFDGIFGMAFQNLSAEDVVPAFIDLYEQSKVGSEVFAFYLTDDAEEEGSELVFGGYDPDHFTGDIYWTDITHPLYYMVDCNKMEMDGVSSFFNSNDNGVGCIVDSGTSYLIGPAEDITALYDDVLSAYDSVTYYKFLGTMIVDCDYKNELPDLDITIGDKVFAVTNEEYVIEYNDECVIGFSHIYGLDFWILGDVFMKKYYSIFDMENKQMGFATAV